MISPARCFGCFSTVVDPCEDQVRSRPDSRFVFFLCESCRSHSPAIGWDGPFPMIASWRRAA